MNRQEAQEILVLYRSGTADAQDPAFAEALELCGQDAELKRWFEDHCAVYQALREKFRQTPVPEGLKEQILAERKIHTTVLQRRRRALATVALAALAGLAGLWLQLRKPSPAMVYMDRMIANALRPYGMFETNDAAQVRIYLAQNRAPADYVLPAPLANAALTGCFIESWEATRVSMICFNSGKAPGRNPDLWLFVAERDSVPGAPAAATPPLIAQRNRVTTARWSDGNKTYLLIADGDEAFIRRFL